MRMVEVLPSCDCVRSLYTIDLSDNQVGDEGAAAVGLLVSTGEWSWPQLNTDNTPDTVAGDVHLILTPSLLHPPHPLPLIHPPAHSLLRPSTNYLTV